MARPAKQLKHDAAERYNVSMVTKTDVFSKKSFSSFLAWLNRTKY